MLTQTLVIGYCKYYWHTMIILNKPSSKTLKLFWCFIGEVFKTNYCYSSVLHLWYLSFSEYRSCIFVFIPPSHLHFVLPIIQEGFWSPVLHCPGTSIWTEVIYWTAATLNSAVVRLPFILPVPSSYHNKHSSAMCLKIHYCEKIIIISVSENQIHR